MTTSMNGHRIVPVRSAELVAFNVNGRHCTVRRGPISVILGWLAKQLHDGDIERVQTCNGWRDVGTNRVSGGIPNSNHLSATAFDYNGRLHPYEHTTQPWRSGWTKRQEKQIRLLLAALDGTVRWGLDFQRGRRDGMHFEITTTDPVRLAQVATLLAGGRVTITKRRVWARTAPNLGRATRKRRRRQGQKIRYIDVQFRNGRLWLVTKRGVYIPAKATTF